MQLLKIPSLILKQLYTFGSLENAPGGVRFGIKNRLSDATVTGIRRIEIDGQAVPLGGVHLEVGEGRRLGAAEITEAQPLDFPLRRALHVEAAGVGPLAKGDHEVVIGFTAPPVRRADRPGPRRDRRGAAAAHHRAARQGQQLHRRHRQAPPAVRGPLLGPPARAHRQVLVRPGGHPGQHRELHRRGAGAARLRRPAQGQRRARPGRVHHPAGHRRGHAGRLLQPRHEGAEPRRAA